MSNRLTALQLDLLEAFFSREKRFVLTGGAALAGFYSGHRTTLDLDLFAAPGIDLNEAVGELADAAQACGAVLESRRRSPTFSRFVAVRGEERCVVDLVIDAAPRIDPTTNAVGEVRLDTERELAANKVCALLGRSEIRDLVDLAVLLDRGVDFEQAIEDAQRKDAGIDPATLGWVLDQITISPEASLPGGVSGEKLDALRRQLVHRLRHLALTRVNGARRKK